MKKAIFLLVLIICTFNFSFSAKALDSEVSPYEIEQFAALLETDETNINVEILYDLNDNPSFLLAEIKPYGFAVLFRNSSVISEKVIGEGVDNPYNSVSGKKYYAGPMCYIAKNSDTKEMK